MLELLGVFSCFYTSIPAFAMPFIAYLLATGWEVKWWKELEKGAPSKVAA